MSSGATVDIDVIDPRLWADADARNAREAVVLVEPLYDCVAAAAALDAGWSEVELAPALSDPPIPLVSFEQPPAAGQQRCRVRCSAIAGLAADGMLLGAPALARPLCAQLALTDPDRITLLPAGVGGADLSAAAWWACGMLIRVLLEELERPSRLSDAAGITVALATGAEDPRLQLSAGARWAAHRDAGGHEDDLRIAAAIDSLAVVPHVELDGSVLVARSWRPHHSGS